MSKRIVICNIPADTYTMEETLDEINSAISEGRSIHHVVINAAKLVYAQSDIHLRNSILNCDIINPDGQSIVWASRILGTPLPERVAGIDLMENLVVLAANKGFRIFFLGAKEEVVLKVIKKYKNIYGESIIGGYHNGYFLEEQGIEIANSIADSNSDILFVAMSSPRKEIFLNRYKNILRTPFIMGVGGSFDVIAGIVKRAPRWMQKSGLEWAYRVWQEPRRMWKRYLTTNSMFIYLILKEKIFSILK